MQKMNYEERCSVCGKLTYVRKKVLTHAKCKAKLSSVTAVVIAILITFVHQLNLTVNI